MTEAQITHVLKLANRVAIARVRRYAACAASCTPEYKTESDRRVAESVANLRAHLEKEFPCQTN